MLTPLLPLRTRLDLLESLLDDPVVEPPPSLGQDDDLYQVLALGLGLRLKAGPGENPEALERLFELANRACRTGRLGLGQRARLTTLLSELADEARSRELWRAEVPLWWEGCVQRGPSEGDDVVGCYADLEPRVAWEPPKDAPAGLATGWTLLPSELVARIATELEALSPEELGLEREGVGKLGSLDDRRSDSVRYVDGREPELLASAPTLAATVQWLLANVAERLGTVAGETVHPPERAMLARYPAPSVGYARHLDNGGGANDNGRLATLVVYLNPPENPCVGGEIVLWDPAAPSGDPLSTTPAEGGRAVLFDSLRVPHQVRPLEPGPARWALTLWFNRDRRRPSEPRVPRPRVDEVLLPLDGATVAEGLPTDRILVHRLDLPEEPTPTTLPQQPASRVEAWSAETNPSSPEPSLAVVATVYGEGPALEGWCRHHFDLGVDHILLVFDHLDDPAEAALARQLEDRWGARLTVWSAETAAQRWSPEVADPTGTLRFAARRQGAADAVAARQTLNASAALDAFRSGELGDPPSWLLHLDGDERLSVLGRHRGGTSLDEHLVAAQAAGLGRLRYLVHELLEPPRDSLPRRYKLNPSLARTCLGDRGWEHLVRHLDMAQEAPRPYFRAHTNGKSAVRIDLGEAAAGVHDWRLRGESQAQSAVLAGPVILHDHFTTRESFRRKYRAMAAVEPAEDRLFSPSTAERLAVETVRRLEAAGADDTALDDGLDQVYERLVRFADEEIELLDAAGLVIEL